MCLTKFIPGKLTLDFPIRKGVIYRFLTLSGFLTISEAAIAASPASPTDIGIIILKGLFHIPTVQLE